MNEEKSNINLQEIKNNLLNKYSITHQWFFNSELFNNIYNYIDPNKRLFMLEIGSYEGLSSVFFSDYFLNQDYSMLFCVDPFDDNDVSTPVTKTTEQVFLDNIAKSNNANKIYYFKKYSDDFFKDNYQLFDFIYVDGSHEPEQMRKDMINAYNCCKINGIIWLDDYLGGDHSNGPNYAMKEAVDVFLEDYKNHIQIINNGYQLGLCKIN